VGIAGRIASLECGINLEIIQSDQGGSINDTWLDPVVIARTKGAIQEKWLLEFRGDIDGFGVGSDVT